MYFASSRIYRLRVYKEIFKDDQKRKLNEFYLIFSQYLLLASSKFPFFCWKMRFYVVLCFLHVRLISKTIQLIKNPLFNESLNGWNGSLKHLASNLWVGFYNMFNVFLRISFKTDRFVNILTKCLHVVYYPFVLSRFFSLQFLNLLGSFIKVSLFYSKLNLFKKTEFFKQ